MKLEIEIPDEIYYEMRWHRLERPYLRKVVALAILKGKIISKNETTVSLTDKKGD